MRRLPNRWPTRNKTNDKPVMATMILRPIEDVTNVHTVLMSAFIGRWWENTSATDILCVLQLGKRVVAWRVDLLLLLRMIPNSRGLIRCFFERTDFSQEEDEETKGDDCRRDGRGDARELQAVLVDESVGEAYSREEEGGKAGYPVESAASAEEDCNSPEGEAGDALVEPPEVSPDGREIYDGHGEADGKKGDSDEEAGSDFLLRDAE